MAQALELAKGAIGRTEPNPRVGCVLGLETGEVLGEGATQAAGGPHAEVMAMRAAAAQGYSLKGATAWVTLEPCAHHGRTPPCCDALIAAGVSRVVAATNDPNPKVAGAGFERMRAAGIAVDTLEGPISLAAYELNIGFFSRMTRGRPWVRLKMAASIDGRTGLDNGVSKWITSAEARHDGHRFRRRASAILTGVGTVLADNPRLDVRLQDERVLDTEQPLRVIVDSALRTPPDAALLQAPGRALIVTCSENPAQVSALTAVGADVLVMPGAGGQVDLAGLLQVLGKREVNELHVEAGSILSTALLRSGLVDELLLYLAPCLLGGGRGLVSWPPLIGLHEGIALELIDCLRVGPDLRVLMKPDGGAARRSMDPGQRRQALHLGSAPYGDDTSCH